MIKRCLDVVAAACGLVVLSPVFLLVAVVIKLDSAGPVFFRQQRIGRNFRPFFIYKFRTMVVNAQESGAPITIDCDPRITRVGKLIRQFKLDEFPQLINVLKGDMSVVGPRPEVDQYVQMFREDFRELLRVRPGITDLASLMYRDEEEVLAQSTDPVAEYLGHILPQKIQLAKQSVRRSSLMFDFQVIFETLFNAAGRRHTFRTYGFIRSGQIADPGPNRRFRQSHTMTVTERRIIVAGIHVLAIVAASYLAFWLRFDGAIPPEDRALFMQMLPWLVALRCLTFIPFRLYQGLWRYTSIYDLRNIVLAVGVSTLGFYFLVHWVLGREGYPRSVFIIEALLLIFFMGGIRLGYRTYGELSRLKPHRRLLIYGAGDAGEMIVRDIKRYNSYQPIGFVDDNPDKIGRSIHGVRVLGTRDELPQILTHERPHEVLIAMPGGDPAAVRSIVKALERFKMPIRTLPNLRDLHECRVSVTEIRDLSFEDLLTRVPVGLDSERVTDLVRDKQVLVTGAGGSIGSELCRQIAALKPRVLVLYERYENSLYTIANDLEAHHSIVRPIIGDVTDGRRLNAVLGEYRPDVVFHAAAHKHVPLMELNVCEAVKNNITGTRRVALAARRHGVERFVLISSDKAVNPSSVMGATKRVAELILQELSSHEDEPTQFVTVRFGNVLGSNGSVVPRFLEQIKTGGPVTVTHPDMRRFFMLIPEAVQLVLHAAALGEGGALYVLDMGDQIKLLDVARNLIRLSGFVPEEEIPIVFIGPRPGEKLFEELVGRGEALEPCGVDKILRVRPSGAFLDSRLATQIARLERMAADGSSEGVLKQLSLIVPTFRPRVEDIPETAPIVESPVLAAQGPLLSPAK